MGGRPPRHAARGQRRPQPRREPSACPGDGCVRASPCSKTVARPARTESGRARSLRDGPAAVISARPRVMRAAAGCADAAVTMPAARAMMFLTRSSSLSPVVVGVERGSAAGDRRGRPRHGRASERRHDRGGLACAPEREGGTGRTGIGCRGLLRRAPLIPAGWRARSLGRGTRTSRARGASHGMPAGKTQGCHHGDLKSATPPRDRWVAAWPAGTPGSSAYARGERVPARGGRSEPQVNVVRARARVDARRCPRTAADDATHREPAAREPASAPSTPRSGSGFRGASRR